MKASNPPADAPIPTMENRPPLDCAKPVFSRGREERLAAGGTFGSGLPAADRERDDGKSLPGRLMARLTAPFSCELCPLLGWFFDFIGDFPSSLSGLAVVIAPSGLEDRAEICGFFSLPGLAFPLFRFC